MLTAFISTRICNLLSLFDWKRVQSKILYFVLLQLFITAISLPILIWWGLPISLVTPFGNLLFGPLLTLFLFVSSFIFFTELIQLPNGILISLLEKLADFWHILASFGSKTFLISFVKPPAWFIVTLPIAAFLIMQSKQLHTPVRSIFCFIFVITLYCLALKNWYGPPPIINSIPCNGKELHIMRLHKDLIVIDPGSLGSRISGVSWASYTFLQELSQRYGTQTIDHLIALQPGAVTYQALAALCAKASVKKIYLVVWHGKLPYCAWRSYKELETVCHEHGVKIIRIGSKTVSLTYCDDTFLMISPLKETISYHDASYHAIEVHGSIDNQSFRFYSAKKRAHSQESV